MDEAKDDLAEASSWDEWKVTGLDDEFLETALAFPEYISDNPDQIPEIHKEVRRALLPRFPLGISCRVGNNFAVVHTARPKPATMPFTEVKVMPGILNQKSQDE